MIDILEKFLTYPELPDIISYIILGVVFISEHFLKKFVEKDNRVAVSKVNSRQKELEMLVADYQKEKKAIERERKNIRKELKAIKDAIKQEANNSHELVANGTAFEISKMLDEEKICDESCGSGECCGYFGCSKNSENISQCKGNTNENKKHNNVKESKIKVERYNQNLQGVNEESGLKEMCQAGQSVDLEEIHQARENKEM